MSEDKKDNCFSWMEECGFVSEHGRRCEAPSVAMITPASRRPEEYVTACADHVQDLSSEGCEVEKLKRLEKSEPRVADVRVFVDGVELDGVVTAKQAEKLCEDLVPVTTSHDQLDKVYEIQLEARDFESGPTSRITQESLQYGIQCVIDSGHDLGGEG